MRKILVSLLVGVCAITMALGLTGCNDPHTHTYSSSYESNATHHWRAATCDCADAGTKDKAEHTYELNSDNKMACSVCGKLQESISGGDNNDVSNVGEILPAIFNSLANGVKFTADINYDNITVDGNEGDLIGKIQSAIAFRDGTLLIDAIGSTDVDDVLFIRGSKLYFAHGSEEIEIADLGALSEKLDQLNITPVGQNDSFSSILMEVIKLLPNILSDPSLFEVYGALYENTLSYLTITTEEIPNTDSIVTKVDFKQTIVDLLTDVKALATYIDINYATKTIADLYASDEFKTLILPALENITGAQLESILTNLLPLAKTFLFPMGYEVEFDIPKAGESTAYEYLASILQTTVKAGDFSITLGTMPLAALVGESYETPGYSLTNQIQQAIASVDSLFDNFYLSFTYTENGEDTIIQAIDFVYSGNSYYEGQYGYIKTTNTHNVEIDFEYSSDYTLEEIDIYYSASENNKTYTDTRIAFSYQESNNESATTISFVTNDYNDTGASINLTEGSIILKSQNVLTEYKDVLSLEVLITNNSTPMFKLDACVGVSYADADKTTLDKLEVLVDANQGYFYINATLDLDYQQEVFVGAVLDVEVKQNNLYVFAFDGSVELAYLGDKISKLDLDLSASNDGVNPIFEAGILLELAYTNDKLSMFKLTVEGFAQKLEIVSTIAYVNANSNLISSITLDVDLNETNLIDGAVAISYNTDNQLTKIKVDLDDSTAEKMIFGIALDLEVSFVYDSDKDLKEINTLLDLSSVAFELDCDFKLELLKEEYAFIELNEEVA